MSSSTQINTKSALKNTAWLYGEKVVSMLALLVVNVVLARKLGPEGFGSLNMVLAFVALFAPFITLGLNAIVTREVLQRSEEQSTVMATALFVRLIGMIAGTLAMVVIPLFWVEKLAEHFWLICILLVGNSFTIFNVLDHWFQARMESRYVATIRTCSLYLFAILKISVALVDPQIIYFIVLQAAEWTLIGCALLLVFCRRRVKKDRFKVDFQYAGSLVKEASWLIFSGVAAVIYLKIDQVMLGAMVGESAVGVYSVAVKFSEIWYFFPTALAASFFPKIIQDKKNNAQRYEDTLQTLLDAMFAFALVVCVATLVLFPIFLPMIFGPAYQDSIGLLNIQIWACCFVFMRAITSKWLIAESLVKFSLLSQGAGAISNVLMNLYMIPIMGAEGAAWATLISYFIASYLCFWVSAATRPMAWRMTKALLFPLRLNSMVNKLKTLRAN